MNSEFDEQGRRIEDLGVYEMIWDCRFCGSSTLPARSARFCPNCGAAQEPAARRFPSDEEKIAVRDHQFRGVSLKCAACGTLNDGDANFCQGCGAPLEDAERAQTVAPQMRTETETFSADAPRDLERERHEAEMRRVGVIKDPKPASSGRCGLIIGAALIALVVLIGLLLFWRRAETAVISGHEWERAIAIEVLSAVGGSSWCDAMPRDAYSITRREEQRSTRRVQDGEECRIQRVDSGDGTFREQRVCSPIYREEPVYDLRCYYTVNRWVPARQLTTSGSSLNPAPNWPTVNLRQTGTALGAEREGGREEIYLLRLRIDGDEFRCRVPQNFWEQAAVESRWNVSVNALTGQPDCSTLERAS